MGIVVEAVYENGVLRPLEKLELREGERVRVRIERSIIEIAREYRRRGVSLSTEEIERFLAERR
ncbi:MAG: antitoxin [Thermoproteota archaeon]|nr:MAG: antitoxin [Candidatus Korarchaeota archaeon]RLG55089.1 MAG: antitoxin [Candidatus Korarchaeota archaeon]